MSRLLMLLTMYRSGLEVGKYISLERIIEDSKESYYDVLDASSVGGMKIKMTMHRLLIIIWV